MYTQILLENFDELASAPGGVAKLRQLVLMLAMRGLLTNQNEDDGSAADLADEAWQQIPQRTRKQLGDIKPFHAIPSSWVWARLGAISTYGETTKVEPWDDIAPETWVVELEDIEKSTSRLIKRVRYEERPFQSSKNAFGEGYVLYGKLRPYLDKVIVADEPGVCTTEIIPFKLLAGISPDFVRWSMKSPDFIRYADDSTHGMNLPRLGTPAALNAPIPLPPLSEQLRIVAKVDEVMALCDRLEEQLDLDCKLVMQLFGSLVKSLTVDDPDDDGGARNQVIEGSEFSEGSHPANEAGGQSGDALRNGGPSSSSQVLGTPVDTRFQEAALVGAIVNAFFSDGREPIGNFRLQKAVYFARRHNADPSATADFLKKAAGPYNPSMKYSGGIAIAKSKSYISEARGRYGFGHIPGAAIAELEPAIEKYGYRESAAWVHQHFKYKKNEDWELLATVDYAMLQLRDPSPAEVLSYVANDVEWRPKIEKLGLTEFKIETAMLEIRALFPDVQQGQ